MANIPAISGKPAGRFQLLAHGCAVLGLLLFAVFAPHSIAGAEISLAIAAGGWLFRTIASRTTGMRRSQLDLPILCFFIWTVASAFLSAEPDISLAKIQSVTVLFAFYLTQAIATRRTAVGIICLMIASAMAGTFGSVYDLIRGRGVVVTAIVAGSPFRHVQVLTVNTDANANTQPASLETEIVKDDVIWKVGSERVYSTEDIDQAIRRAAPNQRLPVSVIRHGEHAEWPGFIVTEQQRQSVSPSGISGSGRSHRFRASGWTKHYEYFAEILQMLAQLSLGLCLAHFQNHGTNRRFKLALIATAVLAFGIAFTAMRSVLVAFAIGGCVVVWRAAKRSAARFLVTAAIMFVVSFGVVVVWQTRATQALSLNDDSSSLRVQVARVGLRRILLHPLFGHGMDAIHRHWSEWGFPGQIMVHLHSTPLQIAFDRGLPALFFWLWLMWAWWRVASRAEFVTRDSGDTNRHGLLLGITGALAGFFVSSLVNYNFGAGVVALVFWFLAGITVVLARDVTKTSSANTR